MDTLDQTQVQVTLSATLPNPLTSQVSPLFTVDLSHATIDSLTANDVVVNGGVSVLNFTRVSIAQYTFRLTNFPSSGTYSVHIKENAVQLADGTTHGASNIISFNYRTS